jgi:hypothetical protein
MDTARIRQITARNLPPNCHLTENAIANLSYLVDLTRNAPVKITHSENHKMLRAAIRTIVDLLPQMIIEAEQAAGAAKKNGEATDMDHFAERAKILLGAALPFKIIASSHRDPRGAWHAWARLMRQSIEIGLPPEHRQDISFQSPTGRGITLIRDLMELAGIMNSGGEDLDGATIVSALKDRRRAKTGREKAN